MSDSGSDSESDSSPPASSRAASPPAVEVTSVPEEVTRPKSSQNESPVLKISTDQTTEDSDGLELHTSITDDEAGAVAYDIVIVPGVYGAWDEDGWSGPGSRTGGWISEYVNAFSSASRVLWFKYPSYHLFSGRKSQEAIRNCSLRLLRGLVRLRKDESRTRAIMFVSHDLGGIIVKDALVAATLEPERWPEIVDSSRVLVFCGSPHRSTSALDMEDRLSRFLFASYDADMAKRRPTASSIAGLSAAVMGINALFIESKVPLRSRLISVYSTPEFTEAANISQAFDSYSGTFGLSMERRFKEEVGKDDEYSGMLGYLKALSPILNAPYRPEDPLFERSLLSLASPVYPLRTSQVQDAAIVQSPEYLAWLKYSGPQILYVHGSHKVQNSAEQIFFTLNEHAGDILGKSVAVLYFSFDRWDVRCDSMRDMASTFLTQLICQFPQLHTSNLVAFLKVRLRVERSWTEADLMSWFNLAWDAGVVNHVIFVINHFDECVKGSRNAFLQRFLRLARGSEKRHRLVVTSHRPGSLLADLKDTPHSAIELSSEGELEGSPLDLPPEVLLQNEQIEQQRREISSLDHLVRHILWCQAKIRPDWPSDVSLVGLFGPLDLDPVPTTGQDDQTLVVVMDRLLNRIGDQTTLRRLLTWLLYAVRPITVQELATALDLKSESSLGLASPSLEAVDDLSQKLETWLAGIVTIDHNEIKFVHPRLKNIMMSAETTAPDGRRYLWAQVAETAHYDITSMCLDYLNQPSVQKMVEAAHQSTSAAQSTVVTDRRSLRSYALQAWTHHFSLVKDSRRPELMKKFSSDSVRRNLARGFWSLSNQVTRASSPPETLFPIFSGLGVLGQIQPLDLEDATRGLIEAASRGEERAVKSLLEDASTGQLTTKEDVQLKFSREILVEALVAAGASANEKLMLYLIECISSVPEKPQVVWPALIFHRVAWLGLVRVMERLLQLGGTVQPENPFQDMGPMEPIYQAVRNTHSPMVRLLLEHGADVTFRSTQDLSMLHIVAINNGPETVKVLLEQGKAEVDAPGKDGLTPLYYACLYGHYSVAEELLRAGADANMGVPAGPMADDDSKWTPLTAAADEGFVRCIQLLLERGANPNISCPFWGTALACAAVNGSIDSCRLLLERGADPNSSLIAPPILTRVINRSTQEESRLEILNLLLQHGADANARDDEDRTPLHHASQRENGTALAEALLDKGADIHLVEKNNAPALYYAAEAEIYATAELLLARGANPNELTNFGATALYAAVSKVEIARMLLENGADPNLCSGTVFTPLMQAAYYGHDDCLELLLEHNATVNLEYSRDGDFNKGWTALVCAVRNGTPRGVRILAEHGADLRCHAAQNVSLMITAADKDDVLAAMLEFPTRIDINHRYDERRGRSALHEAAPFDTFKRLINAGADPNLFDNFGLSPLSLQACWGRKNEVEYALRSGGDLNRGSAGYGAPLHAACLGGKADVIQLLLDKGAEINTPYEDMGTPLLTLFHSAFDKDDIEALARIEAIARTLIDKGADVNRLGGKWGYPISRAAFCQPPRFVKFLLDQGAKVDVKDAAGRCPVLIAACNGIDNLQAILAAGGDINARDGLQRTALHWAAFGGRPQALELVLSSLPSAAVNTPDIDGWTPLCWAAYAVRGWAHVGESASQTRTVQTLLEHGADRFYVAGGPVRKWTPVKIARYCGASEAVVALLEKGVDGAGPVTPDTEEFVSKTARDGEGGCDLCPLTFRGVQYQCTVCVNYDLCFKCYAGRANIHPGHEFREIGEEFVEEGDQGEKVSTSEGTSSEGTSSEGTSSDDEEEDDD